MSTEEKPKAGLFSAVLTAFIVPAFGLLQQDNTQVSADILARISAKLDSLQITPSFINSTASHAPSASSFTVSASARWINILWFLSLLFSLSSALFGIFAKQWIREYLQWNQTTASPWENILVRQLRSEAWVKWKVPAGIAAIPALLEIAVVLFVIGLVIFLWTLDRVVALVISVAAGILLIVVFVVTTLPAFFQHCPYKSPTGWACAFVYDVVVWGIRIDLRFGRAHPYFSSWRHRDMYTSRRVSEEGSQDELLPPARYLFAPEKSIKNIIQLRPLLQALAWVCEGSEDTRLSSEVVRCLDTLPNRGSDSAGWEIQSYGTLYTFWKLCSRRRGMAYSLPIGPLLDSFFIYANCQLIHGYTVEGLHVKRFGIYISYRFPSFGIHAAVQSLGRSEIWLISNLILVDLEVCVISKPWNITVGDELTAYRWTKRIAMHLVLLGFLGIRLRVLDGDARATDEICGRLVKMCNRVPMSADALSIHGMILYFACRMGTVCIRARTKELYLVSRLSDTQEDQEGWSVENIDSAFNLTIQIFDQNPNYADPAARHRFTIMANWVLSKAFFLLKQKSAMLLEKMTEAARISLINGYLNCGCYHDLPWISASSSNLFVSSYVNRPLVYPLFDILDQFKFVDTSSSNPLKDSDLLDKSGKVVAIITGEGVKEDYKRLKAELRSRLGPNHRGGPTDNSASLPRAGPSRGDGEGEVVVDAAGRHVHSHTAPVIYRPRRGTGQLEVGTISGGSVATISPAGHIMSDTLTAAGSQVHRSNADSDKQRRTHHKRHLNSER
ncbi:hypothetical protein PHLCEN_2v11103 [Hermanssonia centrifuga]|uniref:DUF6535 domain-containing protein n=1 Tax=Hermanssonia centrifuga TaxID=98765 RepID=A0A2R6NKU6_9APHY|nr:hypothetical protein PHLCEN_2v11103 [Hermanssonia centrifuga]